ncbi:MAG: 4Fe-4S binding protein [Pleomorphochaeta sp.]
MNKKQSKLQIARTLSQLLFLILLIVGIYMDIRMVIIILLPLTLFFGNFFCGWVCPFGFVQELMGKIGYKIFKKRYKMPKKVQKYLQYSRYILFAILILGVIDFILTPLNGYGSFMGIFSEDGITALSTVALIIMIIYLLSSMVFERAFCNYLCTESAKYGILSMTRIFSIKRNEDSCVNCKKCDKACPMNIKISEHEHVRNGQCINCFKCIDACPVEGTLSYTKVKLPLGKNKNTNK